MNVSRVRDFSCARPYFCSPVSRYVGHEVSPASFFVGVDIAECILRCGLPSRWAYVNLMLCWLVKRRRKVQVLEESPTTKAASIPNRFRHRTKVTGNFSCELSFAFNTITHNSTLSFFHMSRCVTIRNPLYIIGLFLFTSMVCFFSNAIIYNTIQFHSLSGTHKFQFQIETFMALESFLGCKKRSPSRVQMLAHLRVHYSFESLVKKV